MKIAYLQTNPSFGEVEKNLSAVSKALNGIPADLIVLPELFATGYAFTSKEEAESLAEDINGKIAQVLKEISKSSEASIVAGFVERGEAGAIYNSSLIITEGKVVDTYRKIHLFDKEKLWFTPGDKQLKVYELNGVKVGVMICFDWVFPEVARTLALRGAQILAHPSNLVLPYCQKTMLSRCIENKIFAVTANRIGTEERGEAKLTFTGASQIVNPKGDVLVASPIDGTDLQIVEIDPNEANEKMITELNDLFEDRRPDFYSL